MNDTYKPLPVAIAEINGRETAYPSHGSMGEVAGPGMTKREAFALAAMSALVSHNGVTGNGSDIPELTRMATRLADAQLLALEETP